LEFGSVFFLLSNFNFSNVIESYYGIFTLIKWRKGGENDIWKKHPKVNNPYTNAFFLGWRRDLLKAERPGPKDQRQMPKGYIIDH